MKSWRAVPATAGRNRRDEAPLPRRVEAGQHCIIPVDSIYEPGWRSGKAVPTRIALADREPMGIAGLRERWNGPQGLVHSFTMLTVKAHCHPFMRDYHKPEDEKRMVVTLSAAKFDE